MIINFISDFRDIIVHIFKEDKTQNQILSDIHLLSVKINDYKNIDNQEEDLASANYKSLIKAIEYNNALLLSNIRPNNIKYFLYTALQEKRYYFFFGGMRYSIKFKYKKRL